MLRQKLRFLKPGLLLFLFWMMPSEAIASPNFFSEYQSAATEQDDSSIRDFTVRLVADGRNESLPDSLRFVRLPSEPTQIRSYPKHFRDIPVILGADGYLSAALDSVSVNEDRQLITFHANRGCSFSISDLNIHLTSPDILSERLIAEFEAEGRRFIRIGDIYSQRNTEREIRELIRFWEMEGYLFASAKPSLEIDPESCTLDVAIEINPGERVIATDQLFPGLERNDPAFLSRISGVRQGDVITPQILRNALLNLENTELFQSVNDIAVIKSGDEFSLLYDIEERRTNSFDLLFGYVPEPTGSSNFIGSGDLIIRNVFFQGSRLDVSFERLQQFVTKLDAGYESVYIGSTPFGAGMRFSFEQQDTLYQIRNIRFNGRYRLSSSTSILGSLRQEVSASGAVPAEFQRVFDARSFFTGLGIEYRETDQLVNPTQGVRFRMLAETGFKRIDDPAVAQFTEQTMWSQQEIELSARAFISPFRRQVISPSVNGYLMISPEYTESDFNRFGGARSLRGYREDQFQSARMLWGDTEYRYLLDRLSYAFVFGALGYYERPELIFERELNIGTQSEWLYSYGFGFSYATPLGIMQFTYALSREDDFSNGKIHVGITANL